MIQPEQCKSESRVTKSTSSVCPKAKSLLVLALGESLLRVVFWDFLTMVDSSVRIQFPYLQNRIHDTEAVESHED